MRDDLKDMNPYLNAPRGRKNSYKSGTWMEEDRRLIQLIKLGVVLAGMLVVAQLVSWFIT
jgi:hypothetical protein